MPNDETISPEEADGVFGESQESQRAKMRSRLYGLEQRASGAVPVTMLSPEEEKEREVGQRIQSGIEIRERYWGEGVSEWVRDKVLAREIRGFLQRMDVFSEKDANTFESYEQASDSYYSTLDFYDEESEVMSDARKAFQGARGRLNNFLAGKVDEMSRRRLEKVPKEIRGEYKLFQRIVNGRENPMGIKAVDYPDPYSFFEAMLFGEDPNVGGVGGEEEEEVAGVEIDEPLDEPQDVKLPEDEPVSTEAAAGVHSDGGGGYEDLFGGLEVVVAGSNGEEAPQLLKSLEFNIYEVSAIKSISKTDLFRIFRDNGASSASEEAGGAPTETGDELNGYLNAVLPRVKALLGDELKYASGRIGGQSAGGVAHKFEQFNPDGISADTLLNDDGFGDVLSATRILVTGIYKHFDETGGGLRWRDHSEVNERETVVKLASRVAAARRLTSEGLVEDLSRVTGFAWLEYSQLGDDMVNFAAVREKEPALVGADQTGTYDAVPETREFQGSLFEASEQLADATMAVFNKMG